MKIAELLTEKDSGIETWPVSNMLGHVKKFRKIDGWWEHPVEVERWMKGSHIPQTRASMSDERRRQKEWNDIDKEARQAAREAERLKQASRPTDHEIVAVGENAIGQSFPDGDPSDYLHPFLKKHGLDFRDVNAAFKKIHKKDFYKYLADMWDDHAADSLHDAKQGHHGEHYDNQWFAQGNPWK